LITYAAEGADTDALLGKVEKAMSDADVFNDFAEVRRQLLILGTPKTIKKWRFYVFESGGFVFMLPTREQETAPAGGADVLTDDT
jgi:hypothetical protein